MSVTERATIVHMSNISLEELARIDGIDGWLAAPAGLLALYMAGVQDRLGIDGPMIEIGVHKGKFLALMRGMTKQKLVGVQLCGERYAEAASAEIRGNLLRAQGFAEPLELIMSDSRRVSSVDLMRALGAKPRLVHIDGSHEAEVVHHDLAITAPIIAKGGLMIMDDSFNSGTPGVIEGICRYFFADHSLKPFAQCYNKLLATTPSHYDLYLSETKSFLETHAPDDVRERTLHRLKENSAVDFTPKLFGSEVAIFL
jgi:Methyltransferase domain